MPAMFKFCLYVAGDSPKSTEALANLTALCECHLVGRYHIQVIDVFQDPDSALKNGIVLTPTLIKSAPEPVRRIVGTLRDSAPLLRAFGLSPK
jgi:circadian clock protein KaiB